MCQSRKSKYQGYQEGVIQMDILYIEMKPLHMMNKLHIFPSRFNLISLEFLDNTLLSKLCNVYFISSFKIRFGWVSNKIFKKYIKRETRKLPDNRTEQFISLKKTLFQGHWPLQVYTVCLTNHLMQGFAFLFWEFYDVFYHLFKMRKVFSLDPYIQSE